MVALNNTYRKTLTPDRSAKDSGHRFYSPEISRWLNRDPMGELGFRIREPKPDNRPSSSAANSGAAIDKYTERDRWLQTYHARIGAHEYGFVQNQPISFYDPRGLATAGQPCNPCCMGCTIEPLVLFNVQDGQGVEISVGFTGGSIGIECVGEECNLDDCYDDVRFEWRSCMNVANWVPDADPMTFAHPPGPGAGEMIQLIRARVQLMCCVDGTWAEGEELSDALMYYWLEYGQQGPSWYVQGLYEEIYPP